MHYCNNVLNKFNCVRSSDGVVVKLFWLAEEEVRGILSLVATISEIGYLLLPSRGIAEISLKSSNQPTNQPTKRCHCGNSFNSIAASRACTGQRLVEYILEQVAN